MTLKGKAWVKPGVNEAHKSARVASARAAAADLPPAADDFEAELRSSVQKSALSEGRKADALKCVVECCARLREGACRRTAEAASGCMDW